MLDSVTMTAELVAPGVTELLFDVHYVLLPSVDRSSVHGTYMYTMYAVKEVRG